MGFTGPISIYHECFFPETGALQDVTPWGPLVENADETKSQLDESGYHTHEREKEAEPIRTSRRLKRKKKGGKKEKKKGKAEKKGKAAKGKAAKGKAVKTDKKGKDKEEPKEEEEPAKGRT